MLEAGLCAHALVMSAGLRREEQVLGDAGDEVLLTVDIAVTGGRAGIVAAEGDDSAVDDDHGVAERVAALNGLQGVGAAGSRRAVDDLQVSLTADFDLAGVQTIEVCCVAGGHADALPCRNIVQRGSLDDCAVDCAGQRCLAGGRVAAEDHTVELVLGVHVLHHLVEVDKVAVDNQLQRNVAFVHQTLDVVEGNCRIKQALIRDKRHPGLYLMPSAQTRDKSAVTPGQMVKVIDHLREQFDYIILDCPAGIEQGFQNAIAGADRALVVTTPEVSAIRDADRIIGLLEANGFKQMDLIINRLRMDMVKRGDMMSADDVVDILAVPLIGIVPDDENVVIATNQGEPLVGSDTPAGKAYRNVVDRVLGKEIPFLDFEKGVSFWTKVTGIFRKA